MSASRSACSALMVAASSLACSMSCTCRHLCSTASVACSPLKLALGPAPPQLGAGHALRPRSWCELASLQWEDAGELPPSSAPTSLRTVRVNRSVPSPFGIASTRALAGPDSWPPPWPPSLEAPAAPAAPAALPAAPVAACWDSSSGTEQMVLPDPSCSSSSECFNSGLPPPRALNSVHGSDRSGSRRAVRERAPDEWSSTSTTVAC
eukprot:scaffold13392_cov71-Phaeocystis_antarctica.AAC.4